ncbi:MAG: hypothetical protein H6655_17490 [Ardenticatenaceae bacterium]|nr:hypothetical protein [Ardenticatenaceae bacterium]
MSNRAETAVAIPSPSPSTSSTPSSSASVRSVSSNKRCLSAGCASAGANSMALIAWLNALSK